MKKSFLYFQFFFLVGFIQAQTPNVYLVANWDNSTYYNRYETPILREYGDLSDSLSNQFEEKVEFFHLDGEYYAVQSWADYYYWFTKKYWYRFPNNPVVYEYNYLTQNNLGMLEYLIQNEFYNFKFPLDELTNSPGNPSTIYNRLNQLVNSSSYIDQIEMIHEIKSSKFANRASANLNDSQNSDAEMMSYNNLERFPSSFSRGNSSNQSTNRSSSRTSGNRSARSYQSSSSVKE